MSIQPDRAWILDHQDDIPQFLLGETINLLGVPHSSMSEGLLIGTLMVQMKMHPRSLPQHLKGTTELAWLSYLWGHLHRFIGFSG